MTVYDEIAQERACQDARWGVRDYPDGTGLPGDAEMAAAYKAICRASPAGGDTWRKIMQEEEWEIYGETEVDRVRAELIQVAAVAVMWVEAIDRRPFRAPRPSDQG